MKQVSVPYFDIKRQYALLGKQYEAAFARVGASGAYILGPDVTEFEKSFADFCQTPYAVAVGSGTDALILSLKACGIGKGDEVIVPSFTFSASAFCIIHAGATPVMVDVDPHTYTLCPKAVEKAITKKTKAILPVHLYGQAAEMGPILNLSKKHKLYIFEDACQAHGALWKGKRVGSFGKTGSFSFYPTKNLGALGDGGCITTSDEELVETTQRMRNLGRKTVKENHLYVGITSRLDSAQAAILSIKLKHLDSFNDKRHKAASWYFRNLTHTPLQLPHEGADRRHVYHLFVVRVPGGKRDALQNYLAENNIGSMVHYPIPVHLQPACKPKVKVPHSMKVTEQICGEILSLPMFPEITEEEVKTVCAVINKFYASK